MLKRLGVIFFLLGFITFSFSGTICTVSKMKAQQVAELLGNLAEEEDETGKEDGSDTEETFLELYEHVSLHYIELAFEHSSHPVDPLPIVDVNTLTPPPRA